MNMISTGAFLNEMDASNKQPTVAEKFAAVWEKKNAKAARAGGVSLMALSLAACGSSSDDTDSTPVAPTTPTTPVAPTPTGSSEALTKSDDSVPLTSLDDTVTSAAGTLASADTVLDPSTTDNDSMTIAFKTGSDMTVQPKITSVEDIAVSYTGLTGAQIDATNITGSTITYNLVGATTDGTATVKIAADNNVTAGDGVTKLVVTGLKGGVVDGGSATTLDVTTAVIATNTVGASLKVGGDVTLDLDNALGTALAVSAVEASADSTITLASAAAIGAAGSADLFVGTGAGDITLKGTSAQIKAVETYKIPSLIVSTNTASDVIDLGTSQVTSVTMLDTEKVTIDKFVSGTVNINAAANTTVVSGKASSSSATVNLNKDTPTLSLDTGGEYTVNAGAEVKTITALQYTGTTDLNIVGDVTITDLDDATTIGKINVAGTGDLTVSGLAAANGVRSIDASGLTGALKFTSDIASAQAVVGGSGKNVVTVIPTTQTTSVTTSDGDDTVTASGAITTAKLTITTGGGADTIKLTDADGSAGAKVTVNSGAGDDTFQLGLTAGVYDNGATDVYVFDGGDGNDTLDLSKASTGTDIGVTTAFTTGSFTLTSVENIKFVTDISLHASLVSGKTFAFSGGTGASDNLTIGADSTSFVADFSGLTLASSVEDLTFNASSQTSAMTITGTNGIDKITLSGLADTVSSGAGADVITMDTIGKKATVDMGAGADTFVWIGNTTSTDYVTVTGGAGADTYDFQDMTVGTHVNYIKVTDFTAGSGGDVIKIDTSDIVDGTADVYTAADSVTIVNVATATGLGSSAVSSGGVAYVIVDTRANIAAGDLENTVDGIISIESDTGDVNFHATDVLSGQVLFANIGTDFGTLTADNFLFA